MKVKRGWHKDFFNNSFYNPASREALKQAPREARFVLRQLRLKKGAELLDLCCGPGRHAVEFAKKGLAVTGYDFSKQYLKEAALRAKRARVKLLLERGDMRRLRHKNKFDAAVSLFNSFGYFQNRSGDTATLSGVARGLRPGGRFLLDIVSGDFLRKHHAPSECENRADGSRLLKETVLSKDGAFCAWTVTAEGKKPVTRKFFTRLYTKKSVSAALKKAGLRPLRFWGDFDGRSLSQKSSRLIVVALKVTEE